MSKACLTVPAPAGVPARSGMYDSTFADGSSMALETAGAERRRQLDGAKRLQHAYLGRYLD